MNHAQFYDHSKADQAVVNNNNNNNITSSPLKINKASHLIKKSSSSSSSLYNGIAATTSTTTTIIPHHHQQQPRHPVIIYTHSPKIIHTHPRDFMALVQKLTGLSPEDGPSSPSHPPRTTTMTQQHPKSEPELDQEDPISGPESCFEDILPHQENNYHYSNMMNSKCDLLVSDDNECTSVVTDENNGGSCIGDNSSASCFVTPPPIFDTYSDFSNYNYNNNGLAPLDPKPITNSSEYFLPDEQLCNSTDSLPFVPSMRNSYSSSSSESIKEFLSDF